MTTRGEFHSLHRQLSRLTEEGLDVTFVDPYPLDELAGRLAAAVTERTAALMVSTVLFETSAIIPGVSDAVRAARAVGAEVLLDAYHAFGVVPMDLSEMGSDDIFVTAGGYKYAQWGEGVCWLRVPPKTSLRPVYTGWFSDFAGLADVRDGGPVRYGRRPADRFAGSTYDPVSHYRARAVIRFFDEQELTVERLRALSMYQTERLVRGIGDSAVVRSPLAPERRAGFVTVELEEASSVVAALREVGVFTDARGRLLRLGPAPYVTDAELDRAVAALRSAVA